MELKTQIQQRLLDFSNEALCTASIALLNTFGYHGEKTLDLGGSQQDFLEISTSHD